MKIEEKFNKRSAEWLEVQRPVVRTGKFEAGSGVMLTFHLMPGPDSRTLAVDMSPDEALQMAEDMIAAARAAIKKGASYG